MKYTLFEDHLKSTLGNETVNVDIDALIDKIHPLDKPKNKFGGIWLYSAITLVLLGFSFGFYKANPTHKAESKNVPIKNLNDKRQDKSLIALPTINSNKYKEIKESSVSNNTNISSDKNVLSETSTHSTNTNYNFHRKNNKAQNNHNNSLSKSTLTTEKTVATTTENSIATVINKQEKSNLENQIAPSNNLTEQVTNSIITEDINTVLNEKPVIVSDDVASDEKPIYDPIHCPSFGAQRWTLDILGEIGILKPFKTLSYAGGPSPTDVYSLREQHENPLEGIQLAAFVQVSKDQTPFYAKIGLSYTRITEQFDLNTSYTTIDTTQGIISITESQNGDTLTVIKGDIITEVTNSRQIKAHHYFHLFDVPFGIGYEFRVQQFMLGLELGGQFNVYTSSTGRIFESLYETDDLSNRDDFRPNVGMSYYAGINLSYPITNRSSIYASARFRYIPNNFASNSNQINQKYSLVGLHVGYKYAL